LNNIYLKYILIFVALTQVSATWARSLSISGPRNFVQLVENLNSSDLAKIKAGFSLFAKGWVAAPSSTRVRDGLGPHFNAVSCMSCHVNNGRGKPIRNNGDIDSSLLFRLSNDSVYGGQFQPRSILGVKSEGQVAVTYKEQVFTYPDESKKSLRVPRYEFKDLNYGHLNTDIKFSPRIAPHLAGLGMIEKISKEEILKNVDPDDLNEDGISGRANYIYSPKLKKMAIGLYGHKANKATIADQNAGAFNGDLGITSTLFPKDGCSDSQVDCLSALNGGEIEISDKHIGFVNLMIESIAPPKSLTNSTHNKGKELFKEIGCVGCHVETYSVNGNLISPYSDFLLHDMGERLADNREDGLANGKEWKTPLLWGIGSLKRVNGAYNLLHDGRARDVEEAILWHGGEAKKSKDKFTQLTNEERNQLLKFVESL
jgi:CxxC motif-containing protein (DUF1111 family)